MAFFINGIKLTSTYARDVGFSPSAGICLFHFAFYLNLGSKTNVHSHLENSIHHQPAASGKMSGGERRREPEGAECGTFLGGLWRYCASGCH